MKTFLFAKYKETTARRHSLLASTCKSTPPKCKRSEAEISLFACIVLTLQSVTDDLAKFFNDQKPPEVSQKWPKDLVHLLLLWILSQLHLYHLIATLFSLYS